MFDLIYAFLIGRLMLDINRASTPGPPVYSDEVTACHNCVVRCPQCKLSYAPQTF
jgi:hypothetical protein